MSSIHFNVRDDLVKLAGKYGDEHPEPNVYRTASQEQLASGVHPALLFFQLNEALAAIVTNSRFEEWVEFADPEAQA